MIRTAVQRPFAALAALVSVAACFATPAKAADPTASRALALEMARPWLSLQQPEGWFPDYVHNGKGGYGRYGDAMMGYGLLQTGVREGDEALIDSGVRAISHAASLEHLQRDFPSGFETLAIASAYNLARRSIPARPSFTEVRGLWESWLQRVRPQFLVRRTSLANKYMVEALAYLELVASGLQSGDPKAVLFDPIRARDLVEDFLKRAARLVLRDNLRVAGRRAAFISDRPNQPIAYHALSAGIFGRALGVLGPKTTPNLRLALRRAIESSWALASPDGDVAYMQRSQEQAWTLAFTAAAAESAASLVVRDTIDRARYRDLAAGALERVRAAHGVGPQGLWITPALRIDPVAGIQGLDGYAGAVVYGGLTLVALNWAIDHMQPDPGDGSAGSGGGLLAGKHDNHAHFPLGRATFVVVQEGDTWYAVKTRPTSGPREDDLRDDFGLMALKRRVAPGQWVDAIPLRPITLGRADSAGPLLVARNGELGVPFATRIRVRASGVIELRGGFIDRRNRWLRRGIVFRFQPVGPGLVDLRFRVKRGDAYEMSFFLRRGVQANGARVRGASVRAHSSAIEPGYASGADPDLARQRTRLVARSSGTIVISYGR